MAERDYILTKRIVPFGIVKMKKCKHCLKIKEGNEFTRDKRVKDGLYSKCKQCCNLLYNYYEYSVNGSISGKIRQQNLNRDFNGHIRMTWIRMNQRCKFKPSMTKRRIKVLVTEGEFIDFFLKSKKYHLLFNEWVKNNYDVKFTPSIDRIDSNGHYEIKNMQIITHYENSIKH